MNTNTMELNAAELNTNEMETAAGGLSLSTLWTAINMMWDIHNCENDAHDYEWKGELDSEVYSRFFYCYRYKIVQCTRCGKKKLSDNIQIIN